MGEATFGGWAFRVDPDGIQYGYKPKINSKANIGGKVVQVFGVSISDITLSGSFGIGGRAEQERFLAQMLDVARSQADNPSVTPQRLVWPDRGLNVPCWLKSYSEGQSDASVVASPEMFSLKWRLVLVPESGGSLAGYATTQLVDRMSVGIGWTKSAYNGPINGPTGVVEALTGSSGFTGVGSAPSPATGSSTSGPAPTGRPLTIAEALRVANGAGFTGADLVTIVAIGFPESSLDPRKTNTDGGGINSGQGDYSIGIWQINMAAHGYRFGSESELMIPERNAAAAYSLYLGRGRRFTDWSTYNNGAYRQYVDDVQVVYDRGGW
jgi:hypothetical protein